MCTTYISLAEWSIVSFMSVSQKELSFEFICGQTRPNNRCPRAFVLRMFFFRSQSCLNRQLLITWNLSPISWDNPRVRWFIHPLTTHMTVYSSRTRIRLDMGFFKFSPLALSISTISLWVLVHWISIIWEVLTRVLSMTLIKTCQSSS